MSSLARRRAEEENPQPEGIQPTAEPKKKKKGGKPSTTEADSPTSEGLMEQANQEEDTI